MLVDYDCDLGVLGLQHREQLADRDALGHCLDRTDGQVLDALRRLRGIEVLHVNEPDNAVLAATANRVACELVVANLAQRVLERVFHVETNEVGARRHDRLGVLIVDVEDVVDVFVLVRFDEAAFGALIDEQLDLLIGVDLVLLLGVVPRKPDCATRQRVEHPHDRVRDAVEHHEHAAGAQRPTLGREDGERLGNLLAHDHVQRRHEDVADGDGDRRDSRLGEPERSERRPYERRKRGLSQPAESKRCKRDAQLARCQVRVDVGRHLLGSLGAGLTLLQRHLDLRGTHAHHGEFGNDKESVHREEERDKQEA